MLSAGETAWLTAELALDERRYFPERRNVRDSGLWAADRDPHLLETSVHATFACGEARRGPVKRVASAGEGSMAVAFVHQSLREASSGCT